MATTSLARSSLKTLTKYDSFLVGNSAYVPPSFESIATIVGTGASGTITFNSIPSTYTHLQIRVLARSTLAGNISTNLSLRFNGDTGSNYVSHRLVGDGTSATANASTAQSNINVIPISAALTAANIMGAAIYDILDYTSTTKNKVIKAIGGDDQNGTGELYIGSGLWLNTAAVTSLTLFTSSFFTTTTTIALYGIRG